MEKIEALEQHHDIIKEKCKEYEELIIQQQVEIDAHEQYSRRNCALIHGVPETKGEDTDKLFIDTIAQHLNVKIESSDLDRTHRIGAPKNNGKHRPIIAKFVRYNTRALVFRNKRKFKGSGKMITESLTRRRVEMLNEAIKRFGSKNVWSADGEIFTIVNKKKTNVRDL